MEQRKFIDIISREKRGPIAFIQRAVLKFASFFFWCGAVTRLGLYRLGLFSQTDVDVPVICVGNLTTGGTGKTPAVAWVVKLLQDNGREPWIVSRGYGSDAAGSNDELRVLEELLPGVKHIQNPDRVAGARQAIDDGADCIVLDDGFSHLRLKRDLDILMFDALNPFGYARMLPRGLLREPVRSVRRAKFSIFSRSDVATPERLRDLEDTIRCKGFVGGVAHAAHVPVRLIRMSDQTEVPLSELQDAVIAPFCGIGNPRGFERTLEKLGAKISSVGILRLNDHERFDGTLVQQIVVPFIQGSEKAGAAAAVCTQKDAVKFRETGATLDVQIPIYELRVEFQVTKNEDGLREAILKALTT